MAGIDDLLGRVTHRLGQDTELRLDVTRELKSHLEESIAQAVENGTAGEAAQAKAVSELGDEEELADMLWQANRGRMKRRALVRWFYRVLIIPAAFILGVLFLPAQPDRTFQIMKLAFNRTGVPWISDISALIAGTATPLSEPLLPGQPYSVAAGDESVRQAGNVREILNFRTGSYFALQHAKQLLERHEDASTYPVVFANYIIHLMNTTPVRDHFNRYIENREVNIALVADLDQGEQIEPDNALYDFLKTYVFQNASSEYMPSETGKGGEFMIVRPDIFHAALDELSTGLLKPYYTHHGIDMYRLEMASHSPPQSLDDYISRQMRATDAVLPCLDYMTELGIQLCGYARHLGRTGHTETALRLSREVELLGLKLGIGRDKSAVELLVADAVRRRAVLTRAELYGENSVSAQEGYYRAKHMRLEQNYRQLLADATGVNRLQRGGLFIRACAPTLIIGISDLSPYRVGEYLLMDQAAASYFVLVLLLLLAWSIIRTAAAIAARRRDARDPYSVAVGWRRLIRVGFFAIVLPMTIYGLYAWSPLGSRDYGLNMTYERLILEYVFVTAVVLTLMRILWFHAVRRRAVELGIPAPEPMPLTRRRWLVIACLLLAAAVISYLFLWHIAILQTGEDIGSPQPVEGYGFVLALAAGLLWLVWYILDAVHLWKFRKSGEWDRGVIWRGLVAVLTTVIITIVYIVFFEYERPYLLMDVVIVGSVGIGLWAGYEVLCGWYRGMGDGWRFYIMQTRSSIGVTAVAVIIFTLVLGFGSRYAEYAMISRASSVISQKVELSHPFQLLQADIEREHNQLLGEIRGVQ